MTELQPELAAALVAFQGSVPTILKNQTAKIPTKSGGEYSYKFADLSDVWDGIREPLHANGLAVTQQLVTGETPGTMGIKTTIWHTSGQRTAETVDFTVAAKTPQEIGSVITYMKRYALTGALGLDTDVDDDGNAATRPAPKKPTAEEKARADLLALVKSKGLDPKAVQARFVSDYDVAIQQADADVIEGFTKILMEEAAAKDAS